MKLEAKDQHGRLNSMVLCGSYICGGPGFGHALANGVLGLISSDATLVFLSRIRMIS